jgi:hypothetical protein
MLMRLRKKGQNTAEYAILIGLVIAAVVTMQTYVKRGLQARTKGAVEYFNRESGLSGNFQYEPYYSESSYRVLQNTMSNVQIGANQLTNAATNSM